MVESAKPEKSLEAKIKVTQQEQKLFDTLMTIVKENNLNTTLRVAGGWVRDKVSEVRSLIFSSATWKRK